MRSGRCGSLSRWALGCLFAWAGCTSSERTATPPDTWEDVCIDPDKDGHGFQCAAGEDCDESDPAIFEGCKACSKPAQGCECDENAEPVDCELPKELTPNGSLLCRTGTRYCRDGEWSECEGIKSFEAPPPSRLLSRALIDSGAFSNCTECSPDCYKLDDPLIPNGDASSLGPNVIPGTNGGITLSSYILDGGAYDAGDAGLLDEVDCSPGTAPDFECDGIPDQFDPYPEDPPFESDHNAIFMDLGPGDQQSQTFEIEFYLNTADIYLYLDMTGSMDGELTNLISSLQNNNYLPADDNAKPCRDRNRNKDTSDEEYLKNEGITGNIACLIRDSSFGTGWHRDLPFPRPDSQGYAYGPHDFELFQHEQDITDDVELVLGALNRFRTRGGINRPEGGIMGLYALAKGTELYTGWDRPGNPAKTCSDGTSWGYACFRQDAVPIVIWMTDAPVTNGPATAEGHLGTDTEAVNYTPTRNQLLNWPATSLGIETGSDSTYHTVSGNDTLADAFPLGSVHDSFKTYVGDTRQMASNITYATIGGVCNSGAGWSTTAQGAPDAVFDLSITQSEPITISTRGSRFQTALAIVPKAKVGTSTATTTLPSVSAGTTPSSPYSLGTLSLSQPVYLSGAAPTGTPTFSRDAVGCLAGDTGSADRLSAAVLRFNLAANAPIFRVTPTGQYGAAAALFTSAPVAPAATDVALGATTFTTPYGTNVSRQRNSNDYFGAYNAGNMTGAYRRFTGGDTTDSDLQLPNFGAAYFQGISDCTGVTGTSRDAVIDFSLSATTTLRIEGTGDNDTLQAGFDHVIALVRRNSTTHNPITVAHNTDATAFTLPATDFVNDAYTWTQYMGVLGGSTATYVQAEVGPYQASFTSTDCTNAAPNNGGYQAVYSLTPTVTAPYEFNTAGSAANMWLSVHEDVADTLRTTASSDPGASNTATSSAQDLGAIDSSSVFVTGGNINVNAASNNGEVNNNTMNTGCANSLGGRDHLYRFTVSSVASGARTISVTLGSGTGTTFANGAPGFNGTMAIYFNGLTLADRVSGGAASGSCTDPNTSSNGATMSFTASAAGTYYVLVKALTVGAQSNDAYGLWVRDTTVGRSFDTRFKGCNYGSETNAASITRTLTAGRKYYIVVKGATNGAAYQLNARRASVASAGIIDCDRNNNGTTPNHSVITQTLTAGNYSVIIRGFGSGTGLYNLIMRDVGYAPLATTCAYASNGSFGPLVVPNLPARDASNNLINYYLVVRGNDTAGAYGLQIDNGSGLSTQCAHDNVSMTYTAGSYTRTDDIGNAEWTGTLPIGNYYVVLKGGDQTNVSSNTEDDDSGMYQLTVGDQTNHEGAGTFADKRWLGPADDGVGGVLEALQERNMHVITVDSTEVPIGQTQVDDDYYSDQQLTKIAFDTGAKRTDDSALFFKIKNNGTGLGTAIVQAVSDLAENLAMDVGVQLVEEPQSPAPKHFRFVVRAVDQAGDGCDPPTEDRDLDGAHIPDTHVGCYPGAEPRFEVSFTNPTPPNNVETNPADPMGGWNMKLRLIGRDGTLNDDGTPKTYNIEEIPVYIIPEDVVAQPGEDRFQASGSYEQTIASQGCFDNESPLWKDLEWTGDLPSGTSLTWKVCTANSVAELASCTLQNVATVINGVDCTTDDQCPNGYCEQTAHKCEFATGPACSADADCGSNGDCVSGVCTWTKKPIDVKPALARGMQGRAFARVQVTLHSNAAQTRAPTVTSWSLRYTCTAQE